MLPDLELAETITPGQVLSLAEEVAVILLLPSLRSFAGKVDMTLSCLRPSEL